MIVPLLMLLAAMPLEGKRVAVLDFVPVDIDATSTASFTQLVAGELSRAGLETVSSKDVAALVSLEERKQMLGAYDPKTGGQLAALLNARYVVAGSVSRLGGRILVTAQLLDHQAGTVVNRANLTASSVDDLATQAKRLVSDLLTDTGRLLLYDQVAGARVYLDDQFIGIMPLQVVPVREEGKHKLHVESAEHAPWESEVEIRRGQTARVRVELVALKTLEDRSKERRVVALVLAASAVVVGTGAGLLFWGTFESKRDYDALDLLLVSQRELDTLAQRTSGLYAGAFVATGVSAALLAGSLALLLHDPHRQKLKEAEQSLKLSPMLGPSASGVVLSGRF
jgi:TolB-like protein